MKIIVSIRNLISFRNVLMNKIVLYAFKIYLMYSVFTKKHITGVCC